MKIFSSNYGIRGHEIVFAFPIVFADPTVYTRDRFQIQEHGGAKHWVEWVSVERFRSGELTLFPLLIVQDL